MKNVMYIGTNRSTTTGSIPISMLRDREQELVDAGKVVRLCDYRQKQSDEEFEEYLDNLMLELEVIW